MESKGKKLVEVLKDELVAILSSTTDKTSDNKNIFKKIIENRSLNFCPLKRVNHFEFNKIKVTQDDTNTIIKLNLNDEFYSLLLVYLLDLDLLKKSKERINLIKASLTYNDKIKYLYNNHFLAKIHVDRFKTYIKNSVKNNVQLALSNIFKNKELINSLGYNNHIFKVKVISTKFSPLISITITLIPTVYYRAIFNREIPLLTSKQSATIVKTLNTYFPNLNLDENTNINGTYFEINFSNKKFIGIVKKFTSAKTVKMFLIKIKNTHGLNSFEISLYKDKFCNLTLSSSNLSEFLDIKVTNDYNLEKNIDLI